MLLFWTFSHFKYKLKPNQLKNVVQTNPAVFDASLATSSQLQYDVTKSTGDYVTKTYMYDVTKRKIISHHYDVTQSGAVRVVGYRGGHQGSRG